MESLMPSKEDICAHSWDVNWAPRSLVSREGTPNRATQLYSKAAQIDGVEVSDRGTASGHLVNLSTIVKRNVQPWEGGKGPTRSMWR